MGKAPAQWEGAFEPEPATCTRADNYAADVASVFG